jgi:hypothetical protein
MGMTHSTSGKRGYNIHYKPTTYQFSRELILKVLAREDTLRLSDPSYQLLYTSCGDDTDKISFVTKQLQVQALLDSGVDKNEVDEALVALRNMRHDYRYDEEVLQAAIYHRADHCYGGSLMNGSPVSDVTLYDLEGNEMSLLKYYEKVDGTMTKPLVIVSGSVT